MKESNSNVRLYIVKIDGEFHYESQSFAAARELTRSLCMAGKRASVVSTSLATEELKKWLSGNRKTLKVSKPEENDFRKRG